MVVKLYVECYVLSYVYGSQEHTLILKRQILFFDTETFLVLDFGFTMLVFFSGNRQFLKFYKVVFIHSFL